MAIYVVCQFFVDENKINIFKKAAVDVVQNTNREKGCLFYNLHQDKKRKNIFFMFEKWEEITALEKHSNSSHVARFREIVTKNSLFTDDKILSITSNDIFNVENNNIDIGSNNDDEIYNFVQLTIKNDKIDQFIGSTKEIVMETNKEKGCLSYNLTQDVKVSNKFWFLERWTSPKYLIPHSKKPHSKEFIRKLSNNKYVAAKTRMFMVSGPLIVLNNNRSRL